MLGALTYRFSNRRRTILSALAHSFPERDAAWRDRICRENCARMFEMFLLVAAQPYFSQRKLKRIRIAPSCAELLDGPAQVRPVVLAVPHASLMEALTLLPVLHEGIPPVTTLYRALDFEPAERFVHWARERFGIRLVSRREGLLQAKQQLQSGRGIAAILFDQSAGSQGHLMLFFNRVCSTTNLPGLLAVKANALPALFHCRREGFWRGTVEAHPLPESSRPGEIMAAANRALEELLSSSDDACADWFWAHKRWKGLLRPSQVLTFPRRKSYLKEQMKLLGIERLPRNTRFALRLDTDPAGLPAADKLIRVIRRQRPDVLIWLLVPATLAGSALPPHDRRIDLPSDRRQRRQAWKQINDDFIDALFVLDPDRFATLEAKSIHCEFRGGVSLAGAPHGAFHTTVTVNSTAYRQKPWTAWRRVLNKLDLSDEEIAEILRTDGLSIPPR